MIGSVVMTRPSASGWRGTVKPYCGYHLLPMRPAKRSLRGSARWRWYAIAATTTRRREHTADGHREVLVRGYVHEVVIACAGEEIARHARSYAHFVFNPLHYLALLE